MERRNATRRGSKNTQRCLRPARGCSDRSQRRIELLKSLARVRLRSERPEENDDLVVGQAKKVSRRGPINGPITIEIDTVWNHVHLTTGPHRAGSSNIAKPAAWTNKRNIGCLARGHFSLESRGRHLYRSPMRLQRAMDAVRSNISTASRIIVATTRKRPHIMRGPNDREVKALNLSQRDISGIDPVQMHDIRCKSRKAPLQPRTQPVDGKFTSLETEHLRRKLIDLPPNSGPQPPGVPDWSDHTLACPGSLKHEHCRSDSSQREGLAQTNGGPRSATFLLVGSDKGKLHVI